MYMLEQRALLLLLLLLLLLSLFFFFNDTATTEIYTLSLHDALPIFLNPGLTQMAQVKMDAVFAIHTAAGIHFALLGPGHNITGSQFHTGRSILLHEAFAFSVRSEEHTSELQSRTNLVCRLLLEKKKTTTIPVPDTYALHQNLSPTKLP